MRWVALLIVACGSSAGPDAGATWRCAAGTHPDPERRARLVELLQDVPEARRLLARDVPICFGAVPVSAVDDQPVVLMESDRGDASAAARYAHLLMHLVDGSPFVPGEDCDLVVERALDREAAAYALELRVLRSLGGGPSAYPALEAAYDASAEDGVRGWLAENPHGGAGVDGLAAGYRARCEAR